MVTNMAAAMISAIGSWYDSIPVNLAIATVTVWASGFVKVKFNANRYSFQELTHASSPVVTRAGAVSGSRICQKVCKWLAPSRMAACELSAG